MTVIARFLASASSFAESQEALATWPRDTRCSSGVGRVRAYVEG